MDDAFLFVTVIIAAIIFAVYLAYTTAHDTRTGGSDQRNSSDGSDLLDFGSGNDWTGPDDGGDFGRVDEVIVNVFPDLLQGFSFLRSLSSFSWS